MLVPEYINNHSQIYRILEGLQEVWDSQCIEEITSVCFFLSVIPCQVNEVKYVILPQLKIDHDGSKVFIASLVSIAGSGMISTKHKYYPAGVTICACNVRASDEQPIT